MWALFKVDVCVRWGVGAAELIDLSYSNVSAHYVQEITKKKFFQTKQQLTLELKQKTETAGAFIIKQKVSFIQSASVWIPEFSR